jgi:hypothetical protein
MPETRIRKITGFLFPRKPWAVFIICILLGYAAQSVAQGVVDIKDYDQSKYKLTMKFCPAGLVQFPPMFIPCVFLGAGDVMKASITNPTMNKITENTEWLGQYMRESVDMVVTMILNRLNDIEHITFINGWEGNWNGDLLPAHQKMARQIHTEIINQAVYWARMLDARRMLGTGGAGDIGGRAAGGTLGMNKTDLEDRRTFDGNENSCQVATVGGGYSRASGMASVFRESFQKTSVDASLNTKGSKMERGGTSEITRRNDDYNNIFCNPDDNAGVNTCSGEANDPDLYNADIQATRLLFNTVTNPSSNPGDKGLKFAKATEALLENLVGTPAAEPIPGAVLATDPGKELWMKRRSYMARYLALRSVPNLISSWKMPAVGGSVNQWLRELRGGKTAPPLLPDSELSQMASYREIVHALSIDRPNSSAFASSLIAPQTNLESEKLMQSSFYLMQLRDYHDLLERTALALAVQVAVQVEEMAMSSDTGNASAVERPQ